MPSQRRARANPIPPRRFRITARNALSIASSVRVYPISTNEQKVVTSQKTRNQPRLFAKTIPNMAERKAKRMKKNIRRRSGISAWSAWNVRMYGTA